MERLGIAQAVPLALDLFSATLVFASTHLVGLAFAGNLVLLLVLYELLRRAAPTLPPRLAALPARLPRRVAIVLALSHLLVRAAPDATAARFAWSMSAALLALAGIRLLYLLACASRALRVLFWATVVVHLVHPELLVVPVALAVADALLDVSGFVRRFTRVGDVDRMRLEQALSRLRTATRPVPVLAALAVVQLAPTWVGSGALSGTELPAEPAASLAPDEPADPSSARIPVGTGAFTIDRHEFPNREGELPLTGLAPEEAANACATRGRTLCTRDQWAWACSGGGRHRFIVPGIANVDPLVGRCNIGGGGALEPAGARVECRNDAGIHDLVGNAYEWVRVPGSATRYGLVGSYFAYYDDSTASCPFVALVHESQIELLDLAVVGFRCCR
jgi:hypothetical protein